MKLDYKDRVIVVNNGKYAPILKGTIGTVHSNYMGSVAVKIDSCFNANSAKGLYYFREKDLRLLEIEEDEKAMESTNVIMEGNYVIADVQFIEGVNKTNTYAYACYDASIVEGDVCVVKTANHGFSIAKVVRIREKSDQAITREIVCKADFTAYDKRVANRAKQAELKKRMAERASKLQELSMYTLLAESDPEMAELLKEYKEVQ